MLNFFKVVPLNKNLKHDSKIISYCNNSAYKVLCYIDDEVLIFWKDWEFITLHIKNIKFCCIPDNSDDLILLCQQDITSKIFLEVYNISNEMGRKIVALTSTSILESNSKVTALSAFSVTEFQFCVSIGLDNGSMLYNSTLQKETLSNSFKYFNVTIKPIKGIKFIKNKEINMFVCSDTAIFCYTISNSLKISDTKLTLDDMDSSIHCITLKPSLELAEQYLVVARDDGLYCYTAEGRGSCYAISGIKQTIEWFGKQFIIVLKSKSCVHLHQSASQVLIYDIDNKLIVLNKEFEEVVCLLPILGHYNCLIILKNGEVYTLREQKLRYKLSHLLKKNLYDIALKIVEESKASIDVSDILVQYGDHLLQCGDSAGAVNAYSKTIGYTPPFLIIKKLTDFRYNEYLTQYLTKLIRTESEIKEYLVLLNNCIRRINLPSTAFRVFEVEDSKYKQLYIYYATINYKSNATLILNNLKQNNCFFQEYSDAEVMKFVSDFGYYLIKEYPNELEELTKYSLSDKFLKSNMLNNILLPLSLMNKLCAPYIVDNLIKDSEKTSVYNILTELILQMWYKRQIDTNFVIEFFKSKQPELAIDSIFVLCRHYKFWPGIKMMYDKYSMEILSANCLSNCLENFPEYVDVYSQEHSNKKLNQVIIQSLKKENIVKIYTLKYITDMVKNIMHSNPYYILNMLSNFVICTDFILSHLDEFLLEKKYLTYFKCDELYGIVSSLQNRVTHMEEVVNNYSMRPIEFRNRLCDICKLIIKQPSIFFLCQHSFHRECFISFSELFVCVVCTDRQKSGIKRKNSIQLYQNTCNNSKLIENTMLVEISDKIRQLPFKYDGKHLNTLNNTTSKVYAISESSDLFDDKTRGSLTYNVYDNNLNPFNYK